MTHPSTIATGLTFVGIQVRDVAASARFYEERLGLTRTGDTRPDAVVFDLAGIPFAVRTPLPGVDLDSTDRPGLGIALWFATSNVQGLHDDLAEHGVQIARPVTPGPYGDHFAFIDPDGYQMTVHQLPA